jgi:hypothetical protein
MLVAGGRIAVTLSTRRIYAVQHRVQARSSNKRLRANGMHNSLTPVRPEPSLPLLCRCPPGEGYNELNGVRLGFIDGATCTFLGCRLAALPLGRYTRFEIEFNF